MDAYQLQNHQLDTQFLTTLNGNCFRALKDFLFWNSLAKNSIMFMTETEKGSKFLPSHQPNQNFHEDWYCLVILFLHALLRMSAYFAEKPFAWYRLRIQSMRLLKEISWVDEHGLLHMEDLTFFSILGKRIWLSHDILRILGYQGCVVQKGVTKIIRGLSRLTFWRTCGIRLNDGKA